MPINTGAPSPSARLSPPLTETRGRALFALGDRIACVSHTGEVTSMGVVASCVPKHTNSLLISQL
jgi:hypothetical protein